MRQSGCDRAPTSDWGSHPIAEVRAGCRPGAPRVVCSEHSGTPNSLFALPRPASFGRGEARSLRCEEVVAVRQPEKEAAKVSVGLILVLVVVLLAMVGMAVLAYTR